MLAFKCFENARVVVAGIEFAQKILKKQYDLRRLGGPHASHAQMCNGQWQPESSVGSGAVPDIALPCGLPAFATKPSRRGPRRSKGIGTMKDYSEAKRLLEGQK